MHTYLTIKISYSALVIATMLFFGILNTAVADAQVPDPARTSGAGAKFGLDIAAKGTGLEPEFVEVLAGIVKYLMAAAGIIFLNMMVISGFIYMNAGGNEEKLNGAKKNITGALIGLIIILSSYVLTYHLVDFLAFSLNTETSPPATTDLNP